MKHTQYSNLILNQTKDLVWAVDNNLFLVYANSAYFNLMKQVTGEEKELNTPVLVEGFGEGYVDKWKAYYLRALSGESFEIEEHFYNPETQEMQYGHISFSPIKEEGGEILTVACRSTDITQVIRQKDHASQLMDASLDVICTIDEGGKFLFVSAASREHWGYQPEELIGKPFRDLIVEEDLEKTDLVAAEILAGKEIKTFSNRYRKKNGDTAYNLWSARWDHESKLMYCVARDAKEKFEEEQRLKLLEKVINNTSDAIIISEAEPLNEPGPRIVYVNEAFTKMTGYTAEEVIGKNPRLLQGQDSDSEELKKLGEKLRRWEAAEITVLNYTKTGEPFWVNFAVSPVANENGWFTHWISVQRDVTEQKKQVAVKDLLSQISQNFNNEEELIPAANRLCDNLYAYGKFDLIEVWCPNMEQTKIKLIGKTDQNQNFYDLEPSDTSFQKGEGLQGQVWEKGKQVLWDEKQIKKHFVRKKGASLLGIQAVLGIPLTFNNELEGVLLIGTKRDPEYLKQHNPILSRLETFVGSEIHRKRLENDIKHLYQAIPDILCIADFNGRFLKMNPAGCELLGYKEEEILFHTFDEFVHPEDKDVSTREVKRLETGASTFQFENRYITKEGKIIWLSWSCNSSVQEGLIYASAKDITAMVKLRELNNQAGKMAKIGSWEVNLEKNTVFWSKIMHQLHETDPNTFIPDLETAIDFYREDFRPLVHSSIEKSIATGEGFDFEAVIITKKLKERWVRAIGNVEIVNENAKRIYGSFQDITDRKESELRLQSLSDDLPGVSFQYVIKPDGQDSMHSVSKASKKIWGLSPQECEQDNNKVWEQIIKGGDFDEVQQSIQQSIASGEKWHFRWRNVLPNGELRWHEGFGTPNHLPDGTVVFNSMIFDITDEKKAVLLYEETAETARLGTWEVDLISQKVYLSKVTREIYALDEKTEVSLDEALDFYKESYRDVARQAVQNGIEKGEPWEFELPIVTTKGNERWVRGMGQVEMIDGKAVRLYGSLQDIHERKITELRLQAIANDLPGVVFQYHLYPDGTDKLLTVSKGSQPIWGLSPQQCEEDINLVWEQIRKGGDYEQVLQDITHSIQTKTQWHSKWRNVLPDGKVKWHEGFGTPYYQPDGTIVFNSMVFDFTDEKLAIDLYEEASELAKIGNWELNLAKQDATDNMYWSPMLKEILEVNDDYNPSLTGGFEFYEADSKALIQEAVRKLMESGTPFDLELLIQTEKGNNKWVRCIGNAEFIDGKCVRIFGSYQDINDQKIVEIQHKTLTDNLPGAVFQYLLQPDGQDQILYISEGSYQVWGLSPEECKRYPEKIWQQIEAGGYKEELAKSFMESAQNLTPWLAQWRNVSLDGAIKWYEGRGLPQKLPDGSILWNSLIIDITDKKEYEDKYQHALAERATILESISDAFYAVDADWNFTYFNREAENLLKKSSQEVIGGNIWEIFSPAKGTILEDVYKRVAKSGQSENFEYHYPGDGCWYEITVYASSGGVASYFKNIDGRKKAAQELERAYREKNEILESIGDAFFAVDENWTITYWNKQSEIVMGRNKENVLGKNLWELYPEAIDSDLYRQYHNAMETGETVNFEEYYPTLDIWIEVTVYSSENGLSIYFKDISLRKQADIRLLEANERFEMISRVTKDVIWDWDILNNTIHWGDSFSVFGYEVENIPTTLEFWASQIHPNDLDRVEKSILGAIESDNSDVWQEEYRFKKSDNTFAFVYDKGMILRNQNGKAIRMLGAISDFTQLKKQELELLEINKSLKIYAKELERSNEELEQFAFITSHDLQEPLRMISSFMGQLKRKYADQLDDKALQYIHYATDGAKRMKQIILDLLLYSRANKPSDQLEDVNLNEILADYTQLRRRVIDEKNASIKYDLLPVLQTYRAPITQVIHCLLDNALKYVEENKPPCIEVYAKEKETVWEFAIKDNGVGIDEKFYDKIFIIFQRLHNRNNHDGTGIGLSIAKRGVEFLGGDIWLESKEGEGSTFYFTIAKKIT